MAIIRGNDRCFFAGKTGSGKTFLAERLLEQFPYIVVLDNKGLFGTDETTDYFYLAERGFTLCNDLSEIEELATQSNRIVYRPAPELEADTKIFMDTMNDFLWWIYNRKNCILYVDEVTAISDSRNILPGHNAIMKRGRQRGIGCWNASQQPVNVHNTLLSESEHFFIFETTLQSHRDKLAGFMGEEVRNIIPKEHKYFYYSTRDMERPVLMLPFSEKNT